MAGQTPRNTPVRGGDWFHVGGVYWNESSALLEKFPRDVHHFVLFTIRVQLNRMKTWESLGTYGSYSTHHSGMTLQPT